MPHASAGLSPLASCISVSSEVVRLLHCRDVDMGCLRGHSDCHSATGRERLRERLGLSTLKAFRVVRVTRVLKIAQLLRIFRFVMALRTLVQSIFHTLKALVWALLLLLLIVLLGQHANRKTHSNGDQLIAVRTLNPQPKNRTSCTLDV